MNWNELDESALKEGEMSDKYKAAWNIATKIEADIQDRKGIGNEWDGIDEDMQEEIKSAWVEIINKEQEATIAASMEGYSKLTVENVNLKVNIAALKAGVERLRAELVSSSPPYYRKWLELCESYESVCSERIALRFRAESAEAKLEKAVGWHSANEYSIEKVDWDELKQILEGK